MNLGQTLSALADVRTEAYPDGVLLAMDLGEHVTCELESNCPIAVKLRTMLNEMGINMLELLEAQAPRQTAELFHLENLLPAHNGNFDANLNIHIAGHQFELDMRDMLTTELQDALIRKQHEIENLEAQVRSVGASFNRAYDRKLTELQRHRTLPQLNFPTSEMIRRKLFVTAEGNSYVFMFQMVYAPEYLVHNARRSIMSDRDRRTLRRDCFLKILISPQGGVLQVSLHDINGNKLSHYHGNNRGDCWGNLNLRLRNNEITVENVYRLATQCMAALGTINRDSLMTGHPQDLPAINSLVSHATELGREGDINGTARDVPQWAETPRTEAGAAQETAPPRRRWGD